MRLLVAPIWRRLPQHAQLGCGVLNSCHVLRELYALRAFLYSGRVLPAFYALRAVLLRSAVLGFSASWGFVVPLHSSRGDRGDVLTFAYILY